MRSVPMLYNENYVAMYPATRAEAGSNTSTVALRDVGSDEKGTQCRGGGGCYKWATLFLGYII
jgi:hypothetical protein